MLEIPVKSPFPWELLLGYLSSRCIPNVERIENSRYYRQHNGQPVSVSYNKQKKALQVQLAPKAHHKTDIHQRVLQLFHPSLSTTAIYRHLAPQLPIAAKHRGFRPPGCWDPFELCVRTIIGQQVSVPAAQTIMQRLVDRCGALTHQAILGANLDKMGMPGRRVQTIQELARAITEGRINLNWPWHQLDEALADLPGIGPWTRGYLAIRLGRDSDAFPETDVGLIRAANAANAKALLTMAEPWRPYRAYAAVCLWTQD